MQIHCPYCERELTVPEDGGPDGEVEEAGGGGASAGSSLPPPRRRGEPPKGGAAESQPLTAGGAGPGPVGAGRGHLTPVAAASEEDPIFAAIARGEIEVFKAKKVGRNIAFGCPFCARPVEIKARQQGKEVRCEGCSGSMTAPDLALGTEAVPISGKSGRAGLGMVRLPTRREGGAPPEREAADAASEEDATTVPHRLNEDKMAKFVAREQAEAGFDLESAWTTYPDANPGRRLWSRRLKVLSIVAMLAVMAAAVVASVMWISRTGDRAGDGAGPAGAGRAESESPAQKALRVSAGFSAATTVRDRLRFVRDPDRAAPRMQRFYGKVRIGTVFPPLDALSYEEFEKGGLRFASLRGVARPGAPAGKLWFEIPEDGEPLLDWESAVGYCGYDITSFHAAPPRRAVEMRVLLRPSDYYNYEFADENTLVSYQITDMYGRAEIFGYALRESEAAVELGKLHAIGAAAGGAAYVNCILRVRGGGGRHTPPQVWIDEVVTPGWLVP